MDLQRKTVIPGFIDSHIHFIDGSLRLIQVSLSDVNDSVALALRLDYGIGKDQNGLFFTFGEAF